MLLALLFAVTLSTEIRSCPPLHEHAIHSRAANVNYRLPQNVQPISYHITLEPRLEPDLNPAPFSGSVIIELKALEDTNNITLHAHYLNISEDSISIVHQSGSIVNFWYTHSDSVRQFYIIELSTWLMKGETYYLTIESYNGTLHLDNGGFYLAKYYDGRGNERRFATTQFQSINARKAYPSFDEPHMKAKFVVNLIRTVNFTSISNEELLYTKNLGNGRYQDTYKETVEMSTYLTAFVVSDYKHTNKQQGQRVFSDQESVDNGEAEYALQVGIDVLNSLQQFLNTNYSLSKLDQIAIPDEFFAPGAMENWGLVTYRKSSIVFPYENATTSELQKTVQIIAHEYAHQWFGNLVTCSWWRYIWLNEGFANYFESHAAAMVRPRWRLSDVFVLTSLQNAFEGDSLNSTKSMNYEPAYPGSGPPNYVAYQKAGSIIRMFEHFLTKNIFRKALNLYLHANAFKSVQPPDLYQALQEVVDREGVGYLLGNHKVSRILESWDSQAGYPVVRVVRDYNTGRVLLNQRRFFLKDAYEPDYSLWYIPVNFQSQNEVNFNTTADFWMTGRTQMIDKSFSNSNWLIVNKQQTGFYRVNYDETNWNLLTLFLNEDDINGIHVLNRAQLIDDSFNLARAGQLNYYVPLDLSKYLRREIDYIPITAFLNGQTFLNKMLAATCEYGIYQTYVNNSLFSAYRYLGTEELPSDEHLDKLNRINVLSWLCNVGNVQCRRSSLSKLRHWKENNINTITPNLEAPVFCGALRIGNQADWDFLYQKYEVAGNTSQRSRILKALGCSENIDTLNKFLDKVSYSNSTLRAKDHLQALRAVYSAGNTGLQVAFKYIDSHYAQLNATVKMQTVIDEIADRFTTEDQLLDLTTLIMRHEGYTDKFDKAIQKTKENIAWSCKYISTIQNWLIDYMYSTLVK